MKATAGHERAQTFVNRIRHEDFLRRCYRPDVSWETATLSNPPLRADAARNADRIVRAAREAYAEIGPDVPMNIIADRAGVGERTLYRRFATKGALARAVIDHSVADSLSPMIESALRKPQPVAWSHRSDRGGDSAWRARTQCADRSAQSWCLGWHLVAPRRRALPTHPPRSRSRPGPRGSGSRRSIPHHRDAARCPLADGSGFRWMAPLRAAHARRADHSEPAPIASCRAS